MTDKPDACEEDSRSAFRNWTADDTKLLVITLSGTVAANIITVIVVGVAVSIARSFHPTGKSLWPYGILLAETAMAVVSISMIIYTLRHSRNEKETSLSIKTIRASMIIVGAFVACLSLIFALAWIGLAAGIK